MTRATSVQMSEPGLLWEKFAPIIFRDELIEQARRETGLVVDLVGAQAKQRLLDVGCGIGRHALEFARRGFQVTGVDISPTFVERARNTAVKEGLSAQFLQADMRDFIRDNAFDIIVNLFSSFGYFDDPNDNQRVLTNICESLAGDGVFVLQLKGKEVLARTYSEKDWEEADGLLLLTQRSIEQDWSRMVLNMIFIEDGVRHHFTTSVWLYSATELVSMLKHAGFQSVDVFGDFDGSPYNHCAQRTVVVARKR